MRKNKGITLVALVITIIILLILAGVAISMITGGEGLFAQANGAATKYNQAAKNEADLLNQLLNGNYAGSGNNPVTPEKPKTDGSYDEKTKVNSPDTSKLPDTIKYVTWNEENGTYNEQLSSEVPENWYDYNNGQWANIKTTSTDESLEAYWVWIPRFAYKLPESSTAKQIEVAFVKNDSKTVVQADGTEVEGHYPTDSEITTDNSGLYIKKTADAASKWIIHPAFTFGETQLKGIWFAKFEGSSSNPGAENGGGNTSSLKVQVKSGATSWRYIQTANIFKVCRAMQDTGGVVGTETGTTTIDTHMAKNMEWSSVSVLSQSKYGVFNPKSATGYTTNEGDGTLKVWNNPCNTYVTGMVAATAGADAKDLAVGSCVGYNTATGIKGSTTGTVYGVYDMAGCSWEQTMGIMAVKNSPNEPSVGQNATYNMGFNGKYSDGTASTNGFMNMPDRKYYDLYVYGETYNDQAAYDRGLIGDLTRELSPDSSALWNGD